MLKQHAPTPGVSIGLTLTLFTCTHTFIGMAGVDLAEMPVLLRRWKLFDWVEVELWLKIILGEERNTQTTFKM